MRSIFKISSLALVLALLAPIWTIAQNDGILADVVGRGELVCGGNADLPGFGVLDAASGTFSGFDIDTCAALAAAIGVDFSIKPLSAGERFTTLASGEIDVLIRNTTWTFSRDNDLQGDFAPTTFYDGQGFLTRKNEGFDSLADLDGATICFTSGTSTEVNLGDAFAELGLELNTQVFAETPVVFEAFDSGSCDAYTSDKSQLASLATTSRDPSNLQILDETISEEPLGPMTRHGDNQWNDIVSWLVYALIFAEEKGITQGNVAGFSTNNPEILRFLGTNGDLCAQLGLASTSCFADAIAASGNYGEIYDRHLGPAGLNLPRGGVPSNELFTDGGLHYSPPFK
jgi:general L-amino acid transport system substrate-binding protein